jgi:hypothetical protein
MSATETETPGMPETAHETRRGPARPRGRARRVAIPALLLSLTVGGRGLASTAHAAECSEGGGTPIGTCPAPSKDKGKAPIKGDYRHPEKLTKGKMPARAEDYWERLGWPNWRGIGDRDASWQVASWVDHLGNHHREWIETGGRYWDNGNSLRDFMNQGEAGPSSRNYRGTFQEYNAHIFDHRPQFGEKTYNERFVRAISTGDLWVTYNHYKSFSYLGKF